MRVSALKSALSDFVLESVNGASVSDDYTLKSGDKLVFKANFGYKFVDGQNYYDSWSHNGRWDFTYSDDFKFGYLDFRNEFTDVYEFSFMVQPFNEQPKDEPPPQNTPDNNPIDEIFKGVNNLYLLDEPNAKEVMKTRFLLSTDGETADKANGIIGLIKLPFDFDDNYLMNETNVLIGNYDTGVAGKVIKTDTIVKVVGAIEVPKNNDNLLDYENVEVELFLPYCDSLKLDKEKVIGHVIKIEYWINLYNSEFLAIVKNDEYGVIESIKSSFASSVPFNKLDVTPSNNRFDNVNNGYNGIDEAYLQIRFYKSVLADGLFSALVDDELQLNDVRGFVEVNHINLKTGATLDEQRNILTLLKQGVIIND